MLILAVSAVSRENSFPSGSAKFRLDDSGSADTRYFFCSATGKIYFSRFTTWALAGFLSMLFLGLAFALLFYIAGQGWWAGIIVALVNAVLPQVIRVLTVSLGGLNN